MDHIWVIGTASPDIWKVRLLQKAAQAQNLERCQLDWLDAGLFCPAQLPGLQARF